MNAKIRGRVKHFLKSEDGRVGLKAPLALGITGGSMLLAQIVLTPSAYATDECLSDGHCDDGEVCRLVCAEPEVNNTCNSTFVFKCVVP